MLGEALARDGSAAGQRELPQLSPVLVIDEDQGDQLVRTARAGLAMLSLRVRSVAPDPLPVVDLTRADAVELAASEVLLETSLERCLAGRRQEMTTELEQLRADAAAHVAAARHEAATMVTLATEETLQTLLQGLRPTAPAPRLRVVTADEELPRGGWSGPVERVEPGVHGLVAPAAALATAAASPPPVPLAAPVAGVGALSVDDLSAVVSAAVASAMPAAVAAPGVAPLAGPLATTQAVPAVVPLTVSPDEVLPTPAHAAASPPSTLRRFLYVDVILPMIAVLILIVVLLAWVG
jgi:hypothetical protein